MTPAVWWNCCQRAVIDAGNDSDIVHCPAPLLLINYWKLTTTRIIVGNSLVDIQVLHHLRWKRYLMVVIVETYNCPENMNNFGLLMGKHVWFLIGSLLHDNYSTYWMWNHGERDVNIWYWCLFMNLTNTEYCGFKLLWLQNIVTSVVRKMACWKTTVDYDDMTLTKWNYYFRGSINWYKLTSISLRMTRPLMSIFEWFHIWLSWPCVDVYNVQDRVLGW